VDAIKEVVSVSIGSSKRDHEVELELLGEQVRIRREGTDGDMEAARRRFAELDGTVDAFGLGGTDIYFRFGDHDYYLRDARKITGGARQTPVVCGTALKGAVEGSAVRFMRDELGLDLAGKTCLVPSTVDRYGVTVALRDAGCDMSYGDLAFTLGIPVMLHSWTALNTLVRILAPVVTQLPFEWLYPTGDKQEAESAKPGYAKYYEDADIIAGDFHYVRMHMPRDMTGKWIVTNTTTAEDVEDMRARGVELMVTSTPRLDGRSFGTNVMEATMVALKGAAGPLPESEYVELLGELGFRPEALWLQRDEQQT
jgi:hypothetical protein